MNSSYGAQSLLKKMLAYQTVSGPDGLVQQSLFLDFLLQILRSLPSCTVLAHQGCSGGGYPFAHVRIGEMPEPAKRILFVCHLDVVPVGSQDLWIHDPWGGDDCVEGRQFGRGACDMKGPITALILALQSVAKQGIGADVIFTADEESGSSGAAVQMEYLRHIDRPAGIIVCEPTDGTIRLGHRGAYWIEVTATGKAAHASTPELGVSAVFLLMDAVWRCRTGHGPILKSDSYLGRETWNLGIVRAGGESPNLVPDQAVGVLDYRISSYNVNSIADWWNRQSGVTQVVQKLLLPPVRTSRSHAWLRALAGSIDVKPCSCYTDASIFTQALPDIPIVIWGPGHTSAMHTIDECIDILAIQRHAEQYAQTMINTI